MNHRQMKSFGEIIRKEREKRNLFLRHVAAELDIDQALVSRFEKGERKPSKEQVLKFAKFFNLNKDELIIAWMSDKVAYDLQDEKLAGEILKVAEEKVTYQRMKQLDRKKIVKKIRQFLAKDGRIDKAWLFGSFVREDDGLHSDIDLMVEENKQIKFSYFDLADIQFHLEKLANRKVDIGFAHSLKESVASSIKKEAVLIYERSKR